MKNQVELIGYLGADPEVRYLPSGGEVVNLRVATCRKWKDRESGQKREETEWHRVVVFGKLAKICAEYLKKGALIEIVGRLKTRSWQGEDGQKRYAVEIMGRSMLMLDRQGSGSSASAPVNNNVSCSPAGQEQPIDDYDDDVPY